MTSALVCDEDPLAGPRGGKLGLARRSNYAASTVSTSGNAAHFREPAGPARTRVGIPSAASAPSSACAARTSSIAA